MTEVIRPTLFDAFIECPRKAWMLQHQEAPPPHRYAEWLFRKQQRYVENASLHLASERFDEQPQCGLHCLSRRGEQIAVGFLRSETVSTRAKLKLAYRCSMLPASRRTVAKAILVYGAEFTQTVIKLAPLYERVTVATEKLRHCLAQQIPELLLNKHCQECVFQNRCFNDAVAADELSLLRGLREPERISLRKRGVFTVTQLSYLFRPRKGASRRIGREEQALKALAIRERKVHVLGEFSLALKGTLVFLDVEGDAEQRAYYLIGARIHGTQWSFWADSAGDTPKMWCSFLSKLSEFENPMLVHYGSFDAEFLSLMQESFGVPAEHAHLISALSSPVNVLTAFYGKVHFPTYSNSLKEVGAFLKHTWLDPEASGLKALVMRDEWERTRSEDAKNWLVNYNADDCSALERLVNFLLHLQDGSAENEYVQAETISGFERGVFRPNVFQLSSFEEINRAAYWNYQRERVFLRAQRMNGARKKPTPSDYSGPASRPNRTIRFDPPAECPFCGGEGKLYRHERYTRTVIDVRFMRTGLKRWLERYVLFRFRCKRCRVVFQGPNTKINSKFGPNLIRLVVYQLIELRLSQRMVATFLQRMLGLGISQTAVNNLKKGAMEAYRHCYECCLGRIQRGPLIHVDETKISYSGGRGYVWVLASLTEVCYLFTKTREIDLFKTLLKGFSGTLVSDFYSAYTSFECRQQKCLIHLIRDMNDSLISAPFDEPLKWITSQFGTLLRDIVKTIDRYGLTKRYLKKHVREVERFYRALDDQAAAPNSVADKLRTRLIKNRKELFTFLEHDNVPWNNNNAEHAIKAFALLRRNIDGVSSENGLLEYLILLSVQQTCKVRNIDFLSFLQSGRSDFEELSSDTQ